MNEETADALRRAFVKQYDGDRARREIVAIYNRLSAEHDVPLAYAKAATMLAIVLMPLSEDAHQQGNKTRTEALINAFEVSMLEVGTNICQLPKKRIKDFLLAVCEAVLKHVADFKKEFDGFIMASRES